MKYILEFSRISYLAYDSYHFFQIFLTDWADSFLSKPRLQTILMCFMKAGQYHDVILFFVFGNAYAALLIFSAFLVLFEFKEIKLLDPTFLQSFFFLLIFKVQLCEIIIYLIFTHATDIRVFVSIIIIKVRVSKILGHLIRCIIDWVLQFANFNLGSLIFILIIIFRKLVILLLFSL